MSEFNDLVAQAREQRLSGSHHGDKPHPLHGYCFDNAYVVSELLIKHGYQPIVVAGLAEEYATDVLNQRSINEINRVEHLNGQVHYWVEVDNTIIDLSPELSKQKGEQLITDELPDSYHRLQDSYDEAEETVASAHARRCSHCGGRRGYCDCPQEVTL